MPEQWKKKDKLCKKRFSLSAKIARLYHRADKQPLDICLSGVRLHHLPTHLNIHYVRFYLYRTYLEYEAICRLWFYIPFVILWSLSIILWRSSSAYYMAGGIRDIVADGEWDVTDGGLTFKKTLMDVESIDDFWVYVMSTETFGEVFGGDKGYMMNDMIKIIGPVRFIMRRSLAQNCSHQWRRYLNPLHWFHECATGYSHSTRETRDLGSNLTACGVDFPLGELGVNGFKWFNQDEDNERLSWPPGIRKVSSPGSLTPTLPARSGVTYAPNHGYVVDIWPNPVPQALINGTQLGWIEKLECLQRSNWIDRTTRAIEINFFTFDQTNHLYTNFHVLIEITTNGRFVPQTYSFTLRVSNIDTPAMFVINCLILLFVILFTLALVHKTWMWRKRFMSLICSLHFPLEVFFLLMQWIMGYYLVKLWLRGDMDIAVTPSVLEQSGLSEGEANAWVQFSAFCQLGYLFQRLTLMYRIMSVNTIMVYLYLIRCISAKPHFSLLIWTLRVAAPWLLEAIFYMVVVTIAYALAGMVLFGDSVVDDFQSFDRALLQMWLMVFGVRIDMIETMAHVDYIFAPFFFLSYVVIMWICLLNLLIGIVTAGFERAKEKQEACTVSLGYHIRQSSTIQRLKAFLRAGCSHFGIKLPWDWTDLERKEQSPIMWNRINGVPLTDIMLVLDRIANRAQDKQAFSHADFCSVWNSSPDVHNSFHDPPQDANSVGWQLWRLFSSSRERIHCMTALFESEVSDSVELYSAVPAQPVPVNQGVRARIHVRRVYYTGSQGSSSVKLFAAVGGCPEAEIVDPAQPTEDANCSIHFDHTFTFERSTFADTNQAEQSQGNNVLPMEVKVKRHNTLYKLKKKSKEAIREITGAKENTSRSANNSHTAQVEDIPPWVCHFQLLDFKLDVLAFCVVALAEFTSGVNYVMQCQMCCTNFLPAGYVDFDVLVEDDPNDNDNNTITRHPCMSQVGIQPLYPLSTDLVGIEANDEKAESKEGAKQHHPPLQGTERPTGRPTALPAKPVGQVHWMPDIEVASSTSPSQSTPRPVLWPLGCPTDYSGRAPASGGTPSILLDPLQHLQACLPHLNSTPIHQHAIQSFLLTMQSLQNSGGTLLDDQFHFCSTNEPAAAWKLDTDRSTALPSTGRSIALPTPRRLIISPNPPPSPVTSRSSSN
mmetsp:Transcript_109831/g.190309  ORF Transcript_109831/g.190309 Transcript_109831/m.190309 type:complete len:1164 (-) Transcript_109831:42-3533(-)